MTSIEPVLLQCRIRPQLAKEFAPHIDAAFLRFGISDKESQAGFLAHAIHESADFTRLEENLNYKAATLMRLWPKRFPTQEKANEFSGNPKNASGVILRIILKSISWISFWIMLIFNPDATINASQAPALTPPICFT